MCTPGQQQYRKHQTTPFMQTYMNLLHSSHVLDDLVGIRLVADIGRRRTDILPEFSSLLHYDGIVRCWVHMCTVSGAGNSGFPMSLFFIR